MYAMIQRHAPTADAPIAHARTGRALGARLGTLPGFVAFLLLEEPDGGWISVSLCEARETLTDAQRLLADWLEADPEPPAAPAGAICEVIMQRGL